MQGTTVKAAAKRLPEATPTYRTSEAATPTMMIPFRSENLTVNNELDQDEALLGEAARSEAPRVRVRGAGALSTQAWFHGLEYLLLAAMGFECPTVYTGAFGTGSGGSPAPNNAVTPEAWYHIFELDDQLHILPWQTGERAASSGSHPAPTYWTASDRKVRVLDIGFLKGLPSGQVHRYRSAMVNAFTLTAGTDALAFDWELLPCVKDYAAMNNTNWVPPTGGAATFGGVRLYATTQGSSWTPENNPYAVSEVSLKLENALAFQYASGPNSLYPLEPIRDGLRRVTGSFKIPRYGLEALVWDAFATAQTKLQMVVDLVGPQIVSGHNMRFRFVLPQVIVTDVNFPVGGPGIISGDVTFEAYKPDAAVYGYTWINTIRGGITLVKNAEMFLQLCNTQPACFSRDRQATGVTLP